MTVSAPIGLWRLGSDIIVGGACDNMSFPAGSYRGSVVPSPLA